MIFQHKTQIEIDMQIIDFMHVVECENKDMCDLCDTHSCNGCFPS